MRARLATTATAGDRLPDAPITTARRMTSLHEMTAAPEWHLLLCGAGWTTDWSRLVGRDRAEVIAVHQLGGTQHAQALRRLCLAPQRPAMVLVRPDGHIGYRGNRTNVRGLESYLDQWLPRRFP